MTDDSAGAAPVIWYYDIISPYAWLALHRLHEIECIRPVECRPIVFGAVLKHWGQLGPAEIAPKRIHTYRHIAFVAQTMGLPLRFPERHPFRSLEMMRLIVALGETKEAASTAFAAVWADGADATASSVLDTVARRCRDPDASGRISLDAVKAKLAQNTTEAIAKGVFGVPTLAIDGELFWGLDAMDMALAYLDDNGLFTRGELARAADLDVGVVRSR